MNLSPINLTFDAIYAAYVSVLQDKPGKALLLTDGGAVYLADREIYAVCMDENGAVEIETAGCISPLAWDEERCCWESEDSADDCVSAVNAPVFADLPSAQIYNFADHRH